MNEAFLNSRYTYRMQITSDEWQCWSECKLTGKEQRVEWQESAR